MVLGPAPYKVLCLGTLSLHLQKNCARGHCMATMLQLEQPPEGMLLALQSLLWGNQGTHVDSLMASTNATCGTANYTRLWIKKWGFFKLLKLILQTSPSIFPQVFFRGVALLLHPTFPLYSASLPHNGVRYLPLQENLFLSAAITNHNSISLFPPMTKHCSMGKWLMQPSSQLWGAGKGLQEGRRPDGVVTTHTPWSGRSSHRRKSKEKVKMWSNWFGSPLQRLKSKHCREHSSSSSASLCHLPKANPG